MATTATPGSRWEDDEKLDYWNIPRNDTLNLDLKDGGPTCEGEIERAKHHWNFHGFLEWYFQKYKDDIHPDTYVWGDMAGDPLEDMKDFCSWLVEIGEGQWDHPDPEASQDDVVEIGCIPYTKNWQAVLDAAVMGYDHKQLFVSAKGWIIDFSGPGELKHIPAKSQFPLSVRFQNCGLEDKAEKETAEGDIAQEHDYPDEHSYEYANAGWDLKEEFEDSCREHKGEIDFVKDLEAELNEGPSYELNQQSNQPYIYRIWFCTDTCITK